MILTYDVGQKRIVKFKGNAILLSEDDKPIPAEVDYQAKP